jgi:hypothetical protein
MSAVTRFPLSLNSVDVATSAWPEQPSGTFAGPIYGASAQAWLTNSRPDDRAIVVIRDPRDIVISLMYSVAFNHAPTINTLLLRSPMERASTKDRVRLGMHLITGWAESLRSWGGFQPTGREFLTSYKSITEDPAGQFERILNFVGWEVPQDVFSRVLDRFSFEKMTGRKRGESNVFSHHRKGMDGDWRNYFDRELGYEFEETFPDMLTSLGFEHSKDWFEALPAELETVKEDAVPESEAQTLLAKIAKLEHLHQEVIDVGFWRTAAEDRLADIERLTNTVERLRANFAERKQVAEERLADIVTLNNVVKELESRIEKISRTAEERLDQIGALTEIVHQLEAKLAEPNYLAEERLDQIGALTEIVHQLEAKLAEPNYLAEERLAKMLELTEVVRHLEARAEAAEQAALERYEQIEALNKAVMAAQAQAQQRLADVERLTARVQQAEEEAENRLAALTALNDIAAQRQLVIEQLSEAADERLVDVHKLTAMVHDAQATADERLDALHRLTLQHRLLQENFDHARIAAIDHAAHLRELEASFSYRYGFRPVAAIGSVLRRVMRPQKPRLAQDRGV